MHCFRRIVFLLTYHFYAKRRIQKADRIEVHGFSLHVEPTVFHPQLYFSSQLLSQYVSGLNLQNKRVLDMGTGSGIIGLCATRAGAHVLCVDVNPIAVDCARMNSVMNASEGRMEFRISNLFSAVQKSERFDFIIWNPPFYWGEPKDHADRAWNAGKNYDVINKFATHAADFLSSRGKIVILLSSDVDTDLILSFFSNVQYLHRICSTERKFFEELTIHEFSLSTTS